MLLGKWATRSLTNKSWHRKHHQRAEWNDKCLFNEFFTSVATTCTYREGTDTDAVSAPNSMKLKAFINSKITRENKFEVPEIMQEFVLNYLSKLQVGKATGLDGISAQLLCAAATCYNVFLDKGHQSEYQYWKLKTFRRVGKNKLESVLSIRLETDWTQHYVSHPF